MPMLRRALITLAICLFGAFGGFLASFTPLPLPWLLGSLLSCAALAVGAPFLLPIGYDFPQGFRILFIATIGLLIGSQVSPEMFSDPTSFIFSLTAIIAFVPLAFAVNYIIFRRIGGFDSVTAYYSAAPGGLIESIAMGETEGADLRRLVTQQFLRIIAVLALVPFGLSLWEGHPVGSAAGVGISRSADPTNWPLYLCALAIGITAGKVLRLPAGQLTGALLVSGALSLWGIPVVIPWWLVSISQVVVGASLGIRFAGLSRSMLAQGLWLSLLSVAAMMSLGAVLALILIPLTGQGFEVLLITFAPGGVNEMALIALSLDANPAFVTLHHVFRIIVTVLALSVMKRWLIKPGANTDPDTPSDATKL